MTHFASSFSRLTAAVGHLMLSLSTTPVNGLAPNCDVPWNQLCGTGSTVYTAYHEPELPWNSGNNRGCINISKQPTYYFFRAGGTGSISMQFTATEDIDFLILGPFDSFTHMTETCGSWGKIEGCSYSSGSKQCCGLKAVRTN